MVGGPSTALNKGDGPWRENRGHDRVYHRFILHRVKPGHPTMLYLCLQIDKPSKRLKHRA
jgi:hypothetical protein